eukprot:297349_1
MNIKYYAFISLLLLIELALCDWDVDCGTISTDSFTANTQSKPMCFKFFGVKSGTGGGDRYYFNTRTDEYSLVVLVDSMLGETANNNATQWISDDVSQVKFEAGNYTTTAMNIRYEDVDSGIWYAFTQLTLVIVVTNGKIDEIVWDTGCYACDSSDCINGNCGIPFSECTSAGNCDFSAYISWYGTDSNGQYLLSAG